MSPEEDTISRFERAGRAAEDVVLVLILGSMILLAAAQIVMRNFLNVGIIWGDEMLRMLVLWIAVAGAVAASRTDKHINIAILDRFLPERAGHAVKIVLHAFTAAVCGAVSWFSVQFVLTSREYGDVILGSVPAWLPQLVLPVGFGLICYRYVLFSLRGTAGLLRGDRP